MVLRGNLIPTRSGNRLTLSCGDGPATWPTVPAWPGRGTHPVAPAVVPGLAGRDANSRWRARQLSGCRCWQRGKGTAWAASHGVRVLERGRLACDNRFDQGGSRAVVRGDPGAGRAAAAGAGLGAASPRRAKRCERRPRPPLGLSSVDEHSRSALSGAASLRWGGLRPSFAESRCVRSLGWVISPLRVAAEARVAPISERPAKGCGAHEVPPLWHDASGRARCRRPVGLPGVQATHQRRAPGNRPTADNAFTDRLSAEADVGPSAPARPGDTPS
jgi:hypothetical protein